MKAFIFISVLCITTLHATWLVGSSQDVFVLPLFAEKQLHCLTPNNIYSHTWRVNGTVVTSNSTFPHVVYITSQTLSNGSTQGSLTFRAYAKANNTDIECFVTNGLHILPLLDYNIVIQGYLSPPDVMYVMEPHSVRFSWSAPFSLNITDYEPDILYYVINITADDNTTMNTTDAVYLLQPDLCLFSEYRVDIAAVNIVGMGEKYTSPPLSLEALSLSGSSVIFGKEFPVINIQMSTTCQDDIHYNIELIPTYSTKKVVISNSSSMGQTSLTLSSPDIKLNEYYEAVVRIERSTFLHHLEISTFDVQTVEIKPQNDVKQFTDITCHFGLGSLVRGCRIVLSTKDGELVKGRNDYCEYTATREEGSTEGTISVMLPRGEYTVVVYDDEDAEVENPAYDTTIRISRSSVVKPSDCEATMKTISSTEETSKSNDTVIIAVVVPGVVVTVVILLLISVMVIYKYLNGTKTCCSKPPNAIEQDKNSAVVYASIPDLTQTSVTSSLSPSSRNVFEGQNTPGIGLVNNPAYSLCLPKSQLSPNPSTLNELEYNMENNPLYMRTEYGTNTSPVHHYDYVTVGNV